MAAVLKKRVILSEAEVERLRSAVEGSRDFTSGIAADRRDSSIA